MNIKNIFLMAVTILVFNLVLATVICAKDIDGRAEMSSSKHLYLYQRDPVRWEIVYDSTQKEIEEELSDRKLTLNYILGRFFVSINAKCRKDRDLKDFYYNYYNWGVGGKIGIFF